MMRSFVACDKADAVKPCIECINYHRCGDREWHSCFYGEKEHWNQNIFFDELAEMIGE